MSLLKHISNFLIEKVLPIKFKVWLLDRLACDIASQGEDGDTELAHINSYEAKLLRSVGGSGTINKTTGLRQYGGGGSKGGGGGGGTTTQTVTKEEFPPEIRPYITDILEKAQAQEEARQAVGYPVFPGPRIAAFTPEEQAAQAGIVSLVGASQPSFDIAKGLTAASALEDTAPAIQARMSPFMQNVVDIQKREAERGAEARRQQLAAQGVAAGGFGGTREALMQSELERNLQQQLGDIQATGSQAAFQQAQQSLANLRQRQMGAGQQMAGLGTAQQASAMRELGALSGIGEQQRQQQQKALDLAFQQFREEQTYPEASLQQYQSIIRGFPISPTTTQTQQSILPQPSLSQQLIGGAGALAGLGIAGQIPKLFEKGGPTNLKPVPEDNVGLSKLPQAVRNQMGFMSSGGSFPDLSGDGKITQKDILIGKGVINKKEGKRISKSDNKEYTEMLMAMIEGTQKDKVKEMDDIKDMMMAMAGNELTGLQSVVKLQAGSTNPQFTLGTNPLGTSRGLTLPQVQPTFPGDKEEESLLDRLKKLINMDKVSSGMENVINQNNITSSDLPDISKSKTPFSKDVKKAGAALADVGEKFTEKLGGVNDIIGNVGIKGRNYFINPEDEPEKLLEIGKEILETSTPKKLPGVELKEDGTVNLPGEPGEIVKVGTGPSKPIPKKEELTTEQKQINKETENALSSKTMDNVLDENTGGELGQEQKEKIKNELSASDNFRQLVAEQSKNLRDKIQKRKNETKEEYDKRLGFAIFNASLKYMAGDRLQEALMSYGKDAMQIAKDKRADLERLEDRELKAEDSLLDRTAQAITMGLQEEGLEIKRESAKAQAETNKLTQQRLLKLADISQDKLELLQKSATTMDPEIVGAFALSNVDLNSILPEQKVQNAKGEILSKKAFSGKSIYVPDNADAVSIQTIYLDLKNKEPETSNDILIAKAKQQHYTNLFNAGLLRKRKFGGIAKLGYGTQGDIVRE
jgi:hypothetical protein